MITIIEFIFKLVLAFGLNYYMGSRILYAYVIGGKCGTPFTISVEKIIKNKISKLLFPKEFKTLRESLDGTTRISVIGLIYCIIFYFPVQIGYLASAFLFFFNEHVANRVIFQAVKVMFMGFACFSVAIITATLIDYIWKILIKNRRERK